MQEHDLSFVRTEMAIAEAPPRSAQGTGHWLRTNLFSSVTDSVLTIVGVVVLILIIPPLVDWLFLSAQWTGTDRTFCATTRWLQSRMR